MPRICPFCERRADSAEHVYPQWVSRRYLRGASPRAGFDMFTADGPFPPRRVRVLNQTVKVCQGCNSGWMSRLESAAIPLLDSLTSGTPCVLARGEQRTVARWLIKNAVLHDVLVPQESVAGQDQRALFADGEVPIGWQVFIGAMRTGPKAGSDWLHIMGARVEAPTKDKDGPAYGQLHATAFGYLASLVVLHNMEDTPEFTDLLGGPAWSSRIEPTTEEGISWPPAQRFTHEWLDIIAHPRGQPASGST